MSETPSSGRLHDFTCCILEALKGENFHDFEQIHNMTYKCHIHDKYHSYDNYIKKVIQVFIDNSTSTEDSNCSDFGPAFFTASPLSGQSEAGCDIRVKAWYNLYVIIWLLVFIFGVVGNFLVLTVFFRSKKIHKNAENFFVASLALSDLLIILFIVPIKIHYALHNFLFCAPISVCVMYLMTDYMFFTASILNILALTVARYITIIKPYTYKRIITSRNMIIILCVIWATAVMVSVMTKVDVNHGNLDGIVVEGYSCQLRHEDQLNQMLLYVFVFFLPCLIMLVIYVHINWISKAHSKVIKCDSRRINSSNSSSGNSSQRRSSNNHRRNSNKISIIIHQSASFINKKLDNRATRVLILLYGSFVVCWLPVIIFIYLKAYGAISGIPSGLYAVLQILPIFHSTLDPFIYGILHREFRSSLKKMLGVSSLVYQRRGSGFKKSLSIYTARTNDDRSSSASSHRPSDSSFNLPSPHDIIRRTSDGYPIYKVQDFSSNGKVDTLLVVQPTDHEDEKGLFENTLTVPADDENTKMLS